MAILCCVAKNSLRGTGPLLSIITLRDRGGALNKSELLKHYLFNYMLVLNAK
jgi:hypothetical protein